MGHVQPTGSLLGDATGTSIPNMGGREPPSDRSVTRARPAQSRQSELSYSACVKSAQMHSQWQHGSVLPGCASRRGLATGRGDCAACTLRGTACGDMRGGMAPCGV